MAVYSIEELAAFVTADWNETPALPPDARPPRAGVVNVPGSKPQESGFAPYLPLGTDVDQASLDSDHNRFKRVVLQSVTAAPPLLMVQFKWPTADSERLYLWLADMRGTTIDDLKLVSSILWGNFLRVLSRDDWPTTSTAEIANNLKVVLR